MYRDFVKREMAKMRGSSIPPKERMAKIGAAWRKQKSRGMIGAGVKAPRKPKAARSGMTGGSASSRDIYAVAPHDSSMRGAGIDPYGAANETIQQGSGIGRDIMHGISSVASVALPVLSVAKMLL